MPSLFSPPVKLATGHGSKALVSPCIVVISVKGRSEEREKERGLGDDEEAADEKAKTSGGMKKMIENACWAVKGKSKRKHGPSKTDKWPHYWATVVQYKCNCKCYCYC